MGVELETLARDLHEAGREAVVKGATVAAGSFGEKSRTFIEWDDLPDEAREGRRIQARWLASRYSITLKAPQHGETVAEAARRGFHDTGRDH
jgi:hypothetical protein